MKEIAGQNLAELEKRYRTTVLIVLAQIAVTIILTVTAWILPSRDANVPPQTITTLWVAVLFLAIGTFLLRRVLNNWERIKNTAILKGLRGVLGILQTNALILGSLAEIISIMGFVITTLTGDKFDMLRAGVIALIVFLINFPRKNVWKKIAANLEA